MSKSKDAPSLDGTGRERPIFVAHYPHGEPRLDALVEAFERGNFRHVRQEARAFLANSPSPELRRAAEDLVRRTRPDPLIVVFLGLAALLLTCLATWVYT